MQHHFHNLESKEFITAEECRLIDLIALPNPTIDKVKLKLESDREECFFPVTVEVFNVLGQKIQVNHWQTGTVEVDLSSLAPATYIFKIKYANNYQAIKVIKY